MHIFWFRKEWTPVLCKHILFIVPHVLNSDDLQSLPDAARKDIKHQLLREQPTGKRKDFHAILAEHACFSQPQTWKV